MDNLANLIKMTYEELFSLFLLENTPLLDVDELISEAVCDEKTERLGLGRAIPGLDNFRILSKAHTERLAETDREVFENLIGEMSEREAKRARGVVERTYKEVMTANPDEPDKMTCLGPYPDVEFCFDNDSIVIVLAVDMDELEDGKADRIRIMARDMQNNLFKEIGEDLGIKLILYVPGMQEEK